jgi:hypothetical protein
MNPRLLIDGIIQQTTVLIAQLSTAAGVRSPLAHVADEVFLTLAQEIERQGVSRKVVADMFGLALRSYQRKVQRLEESRSEAGRTLWEAVLAHITEQAPVRREEVIARFRHDDELAVNAVLADLVTSGLVYSSGRGEATVYGITSDADRRALSTDDSAETLAVLLWGAVFRSPGISVRELIASTRVSEPDTRAALARLMGDGRVTCDGEADDSPLRAAPFIIHAGSPKGWEAAVFDHFQAMANAIADKLRLRALGSPQHDLVGGTTFHFGVHPGHPYEERVLGSLKRVREQMTELWNEVAGYNREHPTPDEAATRVTFYLGQAVRPPADSEQAAAILSRASTGEEERQ